MIRNSGRLPDGVYEDFVIRCYDSDEHIALPQVDTDPVSSQSIRRVFRCNATSQDGKQTVELNLELNQASNAMTIFNRCENAGLKMVSDIELDESEYDVLLDVSWGKVFECTEEVKESD